MGRNGLSIFHEIDKHGIIARTEHLQVHRVAAVIDRLVEPHKIIVFVARLKLSCRPMDFTPGGESIPIGCFHNETREFFAGGEIKCRQPHFIGRQIPQTVAGLQFHLCWAAIGITGQHVNSVGNGGHQFAPFGHDFDP